jgi:ankyrin repeat protein
MNYKSFFSIAFLVAVILSQSASGMQRDKFRSLCDEIVVFKDAERIKRCLQEFNVNYANDNGDTLLTIAAGQGYDDPFNHKPIENIRKIVKILLECGADVNHANRQGETALERACWSGDFEIVKLLLEYGANVNYINPKNGKTPLLRAAALHSIHFETVRLLLEYNANVNCPNIYDGWTPLHQACWAGNFEVVKILLDYGADISCKDKSGRSPLDIANQKGYSEIAALLAAEIKNRKLNHKYS